MKELGPQHYNPLPGCRRKPRKPGMPGKHSFRELWGCFLEVWRRQIFVFGGKSNLKFLEGLVIRVYLTVYVKFQGDERFVFQIFRQRKLCLVETNELISSTRAGPLLNLSKSHASSIVKSRKLSAYKSSTSDFEKRSLRMANVHVRVHA